MKTYLFYDLETTGLQKTFDQVLQYAAVRTNLALEPLDTHTYFVTLNKETIPAPQAVLTHLMGATDTAHGMSEYDALQRIHVALNTPNTVSVGYNTLGFDDEFLRFSFYRNLLTPYTHQYANGCGRMDLYPITIFYYLFKPDCILWPMENGIPSLKLENLNAANEFHDGPAHDALVDVMATLGLARAFHQDQTMWNYVTGYFDKTIDMDRFARIPVLFASHRHGVYLDGRLGGKNNYLAPVLSLGEHHHYRNQQCLLRLDLPALRDLTLDNIGEKTWCFRKKMGEPGFILPPEERFMAKLSAERQLESERNLIWLKEHPELLNAIIEYHCNFTYPLVTDADIGTTLYTSPFWSNDDTRRAQQFHTAAPTQKAELVDAFSTEALQTLALRIVGRHYPEHLTSEQKTVFDDYVHRSRHEPMVDFMGNPRLTIIEALATIEMLFRERVLSDVQQEKLRGLTEYLLSL